MPKVINAHDLGIAGGYIIEQVLNERIAELEVENTKLRELVRDIFGGYKGAVEMLPSSYSKNVAESAVMDISDRMRELGIKVKISEISDRRPSKV